MFIISFKLKDDTLSVHILNVGDGDSLILEFPKQDGIRCHMVVDCAKANKTIDYLQKLGATSLKLVVATHPHGDHIDGLKAVMEKYNEIEQFWDSGFRHTIDSWYELIKYLNEKRKDVIFIRPTSGMTITIAGVEVTVIAPSIYLRNRYDTWGVNINNASIVLKLTYGEKSIVLGGDAQMDSWGKITEEFPNYEKTTNPEQHIKMDETYNPLDCIFLKTSHHGSKHGTALEVAERLSPKHVAISCKKDSGYGFPHELAVGALNEIKSKIKYTYDGTIVFGINMKGTAFLEQYNDKDQDFAPAPVRA